MGLCRFLVASLEFPVRLAPIDFGYSVSTHRENVFEEVS
jgi:hypothetical protein